MEQNEETGWRGFLKLCHQAKTLQDLEELLELFLTFEEKKDLSMRYWIVQELLKEKKTQREIATDLHVSISKITRGSNALKQINKNLKEKILKNLL